MTEDVLNVGHSSDPLTAPDRPPSVCLARALVWWGTGSVRRRPAPRSPAASPPGARARAGLGGPGAREPGGRTPPPAGRRSRCGLSRAPRGRRWRGSAPAGFLQLPRPSPYSYPEAPHSQPSESSPARLCSHRWSPPVLFLSSCFPGSGASSLPTAASALTSDGSTEAEVTIRLQRGAGIRTPPLLIHFTDIDLGQVIYTFLATFLNTGAHCRI